MKTTILGGVILILPISLVVLLGAKVLSGVSELLIPVVDALPVQELAGVAVITLLAPMAILAGCFLAGLLLRTAAVTRLVHWLERAVFSRLPGFSIVKQLTQRFSGQADGSLFAPAMVDLYGSGAVCLAFITDELDSGEFVVLVPLSPTPNVGTLYVLGKDRVKLMDIPLTQAIDMVTKWGIGSRRILGARGGPEREGVAYGTAVSEVPPYPPEQEV